MKLAVPVTIAPSSVAAISATLNTGVSFVPVIVTYTVSVSERLLAALSSVTVTSKDTVVVSPALNAWKSEPITYVYSPLDGSMLTDPCPVAIVETLYVSASVVSASVALAVPVTTAVESSVAAIFETVNSGASFVPVTVTVTVFVSDAVAVPLLSVTVTSNVTSLVSPSARSWKSDPVSYE